ncbi:MAG: HD domain-containing protein [Candidatus Margulisbacteria bacterium]|nr:HD domain-containing protein [Candidatus Margulisiibacteriota bacterium]
MANRVVINLKGLSVNSFRKVLEKATSKRTLAAIQERVLARIMGSPHLPASVKAEAQALFLEMDLRKPLLPDLSSARNATKLKREMVVFSLQRIQARLFLGQKSLSAAELIELNNEACSLINGARGERCIKNMIGVVLLEIGARIDRIGHAERDHDKEVDKMLEVQTKLFFSNDPLTRDELFQIEQKIVGIQEKVKGWLGLERLSAVILLEISARQYRLECDTKPVMIELKTDGMLLPPAPRPAYREFTGEIGLTPVIIQLIDNVKSSGQMLPFSRNIGEQELQDIVGHGFLRTNGRQVKYFRYGLSHEYGEIVVVMKPGFWETEKDRSRVVSLFLEEFKGQRVVNKVHIFEKYPKREDLVAIWGSDESWKILFVDPEEQFLCPKGNIFELLGNIQISQQRMDQMIMLLYSGRVHAVKQMDDKIGKEKLFKDLAQRVEYNRRLGQAQAKPQCVGHTVLMGDADKLMSTYPQLEVPHDVPLDQVQRIMVPDHLWDQTVKLVEARRPEMLKLLCRVKGTGQTKDEFQAGRENLTRRSSRHHGSFEPVFGYDSFFLFEQAYYREMLAAYRLAETTQTSRLAVNPPLAGCIAIQPDTAFRAQLQYPDFLALIPSGNPLRRLIGLQQNPSHSGLDPLQHTFNALHLLETDDLASRGIVMPTGFKRPLKELLRIALLYHDVGKLSDPVNPRHADQSALIAAGILADPLVSGVGKLTAQETEFILTLIRTHHLFGDINKENLTLPEAVDRAKAQLSASAFSSAEMFYFHLLIASADIHSIPGVRARIVPEKWDNYVDGIYKALLF